MPKRQKKKLEEFYWHEALDRAFLASQFFVEFVEEHDAVLGDERLKRSAEKISLATGALYQDIGRAGMKTRNDR